MATTATTRRPPATAMGRAASEAARRCQRRGATAGDWEALRAAVWWLLWREAGRLAETPSCSREDVAQAMWPVVADCVEMWDSGRTEFATYLAAALRNKGRRHHDATAYPVRLPTRDTDAADPGRVAARAAARSRAEAGPAFWDALADRESDEAERRQWVGEMMPRVLDALDRLGRHQPATAEVVRMRFGVGREPMHYAPIGRAFGRSKAWAMDRTGRGLAALAEMLGADERRSA